MKLKQYESINAKTLSYCKYEKVRGRVFCNAENINMQERVGLYFQYKLFKVVWFQCAALHSYPYEECIIYQGRQLVKWCKGVSQQKVNTWLEKIIYSYLCRLEFVNWTAAGAVVIIK